jgi:hypothetical protein
MYLTPVELEFLTRRREKEGCKFRERDPRGPTISQPFRS